ncbi:MAG: phosphotransferase [Candidatus Eremiobacteraeota bacterium]|nr:phosphotransferase [Candidatus Eremiobacteraeota bacterium]
MSPDEALAAAASFGIDVAGAVAVPVPGGWTNAILRIDAASGRYVVRRYGRLHVTRRAILFEHRVMRHAAERIAEVAPPLGDRRGRTLHESAGGLVAVFPYVEGSTGARDCAAGCSAARLLARFHRTMGDVHLAGGTRSTRFLGILPWLRERFQRFAAEPRTARSIDWSALIAAVGSATVGVAACAAALPVCVVHGDPNPGNVVRAPDGDVRALIDFDFAHETERVYDVGALLDEFGRERHEAPLALERIAPIVNAYAAEAPLLAHERALIPEAMLRRAATMAWYVATRHGERIPGDVGGAPCYAARAVEIAVNAPRIRETLL